MKVAKLYTADILDQCANSSEAQVCEVRFENYGGTLSFFGSIETVATFENNTDVSRILDGNGEGRVLVVDGRGSLRHALCGGNVIAKARRNGWSGMILNGCIRDVHEAREVDIGIKAIGSCPRPPRKTGHSEVGTPLVFGNVTFVPGSYVYADEDGVIVTQKRFH